MAGSYNHAVGKDGRLYNSTMMAAMATETQGDAYETIKEMFGMIWFLAAGNHELVRNARNNYKSGIAMSPGIQKED